MPELAGDLVAELVESQLDCGAFPSTMVEEGRPHPDVNGFVTAQVLRALGDASADPRLGPTVARALDFLEGCEDPDRPWAYRFWPEAWRPKRLPLYPADADDSSVIPWELARHGRRDRQSLMRTVLHVLIKHRVPAGARPPASWVRPGAFWTWLDAGFGYNVVDCTVNANVVGLMAGAGLTHAPGYEDACATIEEGVRMAAGDPVQTRLLSPYYAGPHDLLEAVRHAVARGASRLRPSLELLERQCGPTATEDGAPVFCSAYGRVEWRSPLLQRVRRAAPAATQTLGLPPVSPPA
jgi:hypothetical protein